MSCYAALYIESFNRRSRLSVPSIQLGFSFYAERHNARINRRARAAATAKFSMKDLLIARPVHPLLGGGIDSAIYLAHRFTVPSDLELIMTTTFALLNLRT